MNDHPCHKCTKDERKARKNLCDIIDPPDGIPVRCAHVHTRLKVEVLQYYLEIFSNAMKDKFPDRHFLDLFSGSGLCYDRDNGGFFEGSALVALKLKHKFSSYVFVDRDEHTADALKKRVEMLGGSFGGRVRFLKLDANHNIDQILSAIDRGRSISVAFIDPNGLDIHFSTIEHLSQIDHMDLIIHFSVSDLHRNLATYTGGNPKADLFFGTNDWPRDSREWVPFYKARLAELGYINIEGDEEGSVAIKAPNNANIYYLIFASKRELGLKFWREAKKKYLNQELFPS